MLLSLIYNYQYIFRPVNVEVLHCKRITDCVNINVSSPDLRALESAGKALLHAYLSYGHWRRVY